MKTILLILIVLFTFSTMNAQQDSSIEPLIVNTDTFKNTKIDFYETLIAANNFDIKIEKHIKVAATTSKIDFYKNLMIKNGFAINIEEDAHLASRDKKAKDSILTNTTKFTGLLP